MNGIEPRTTLDHAARGGKMRLFHLCLALFLLACHTEEPSPSEPRDAAQPDASQDTAADTDKVEASDVAESSTVIDAGHGMVLMPEGYAIDATEVTRAAYAAWLASKPSTDAQPTYCAWNTSFEPDKTCLQSQYVCQNDCDDHPQVCVDWCDAFSYCKGNGKRLCGAIGGGSVAWYDRIKPEIGQWISACSSHGKNAYPYLEKPEPGGYWPDKVCNDTSVNAGTTVPVGAMPDCQAPGAYAGVYDLSGNVYEWIDACEAYEGFLDGCATKGGGFATNPYGTACANEDGGERHATGEAIGFRCCSD